jgi:hypothetical protein
MANLLQDKVAVVTGAGRGIGRAIALAMADEGAKVVVNDWGKKGIAAQLQAGDAAKVAEEIKSKGGIAIAQTDSVADKGSGERIIQTAIDKFGRIDILVNNAATTSDRMVWNMDEEQWDLVVGVILKGAFNCTKPAATLMRKQGHGRIISLTSGAGLLGNTGACNYVAAKAALVGFMQGVARDLGQYGVTANTISPGAQPIEMIKAQATGEYSGIPALKAAQEQRKKLGIKRLFLGVGATGVESPDRIAPLAVFLASDSAANINGQFFGVRGELIEVWTLTSIMRTLFDESGKWRVMPAVMADVLNFAPAQQHTEK